jgi:N-acetyl-anhydromuramyl-L-alanine amidase AmpD
MISSNVRIITREEWKANPPRYAFEKHYPDRITIHHQGSSDKEPLAHVMGFFKGAQSVKGIQEYHQKTRKYCDIGYHALIAPNGDIYQGRPFDVVGAHVKSNNTGNIGIMLVGNMEVEVQTKAQITSLKKLILYLKVKFPQIDIQKRLYGHKDFMNTDCPGKNLYPVVFALKTGKESLYEVESDNL